MNRPNILVFFTDQQRPDSIGCYGQSLPTTPHLDMMAGEGVRFTHAFSPNPLCGPCRASLQSGRYPTATGNHVNGIPLAPESDTLAKQLSAAGYSTGYLGKLHLASKAGKKDTYINSGVPKEKRQGYKDYWLVADLLEMTSHGYGGFLFDQNNLPVTFDNKTHRVDFMTDHLLDAIDQLNDPDKPFFMMASYLEPHHQNSSDEYEAPTGMADTFADAEIPGDLAALKGNWETRYSDYLGCVHSLDLALGRVLEKLDELEITENTLILFISDHGCHFRTRNAEYKRSAHDASIHVPMVAKGPGFENGAVKNTITNLLDIPATILAAAGVDVPEDWHGRPLQEADSGDWRDVSFSQLSESQVGRCIRTHRWTYSVSRPVSDWLDKGEPLPQAADFYVEDLLYDNENDPHQLNNLIRDPDYAEVRIKLKDILLEQIERYEELQPEIRPSSA